MDNITIGQIIAVVQGGSILEILKEYKKVLSQREEARTRINELENNK